MSLTLEIIVPCLNEEDMVPLFYQAVSDALRVQENHGLLWSVRYIDDGSTDKTLQAIQDLAQQHSNVHYLSFSRNFGKEAAIFAGLEHSQGELVALMDVDLQDPPALLNEMLPLLQSEAFDCVATYRKNRQGEPFFRSLFANLFYRCINLISKTNIVPGARDFRMMNRKMVEALISLREYNRFSKGLFSWIGFQVKWLNYENHERVAGKTKWSFWHLFLYSLDGILAFSVFPLALVSLVGIGLAILAFAGMLAIIVRTLLYGDPVAGWPSMVTIMCFIGGLQLLGLGIIGQYLSKAYQELKHRPLYIVKTSSQP